MRLDAPFQLMVDGAHGQIAFEFLEGLFDFGELKVKLPEFGRVCFREVGSQDVATFSPPGDA